MKSDKNMICMDKDHYYKAYIEQRERLHANLVQQLLAKLELKKQYIMAKSEEIIGNFTKYRDDFIQGMPSELKTTKVSDYITKGNGTFEECMKRDNEEALTGIYKLFKNGFEKANEQKKANKENEGTSTAPFSEKKKKKVVAFKKDHSKNLETPNSKFAKTKEFKDITNLNQARQPEEESVKHQGIKSNSKKENISLKSSKKRKWDQFGSNAKENKTIARVKQDSERKFNHLKNIAF